MAVESEPNRAYVEAQPGVYQCLGLSEQYACGSVDPAPAALSWRPPPESVTGERVNSAAANLTSVRKKWKGKKK